MQKPLLLSVLLAGTLSVFAHPANTDTVIHPTGNSNTNHQAIIGFKGKSYFIYHNGALVPDAGSFHRSACIDYLYYNPDGMMKRVVMTSEGVQ